MLTLPTALAFLGISTLGTILGLTVATLVAAWLERRARPPGHVTHLRRMP